MRRATLVAGLLPLLLLSVGAASDVPTPAQHLRAPEHITPDTRTELAARMGRHGETMSNLVRAVVLFDRPTIRILAGRIADEEVIAQAGKSVHDRRSLLLPPDFPAEQTRLSVAARQLAVAAVEGSDDRTLADRFAGVTGTCVTCHSIYLHGRPGAQPLVPKGK
jgi:cytochrome c556